MTNLSEEAVLYIHLADDGGLLSIDGVTGLSAWLTMSDLQRRLDETKKSEGTVLLSQEHGSPLTELPLQAIESAGLPVQRANQVHPDARRRGGCTSLMAGAYVGAGALVRDLVKRGAPLDDQDQDGYTPLIYAANGGQQEMVDLLLQFGAHPNVRDREGSTALMFAAQHGNLKTVKRLLNGGADPGLRRTTDGLSAEDLALSHGHERVGMVIAAVERQMK